MSPPASGPTAILDDSLANRINVQLKCDCDESRREAPVNERKDSIVSEGCRGGGKLTSQVGAGQVWCGNPDSTRAQGEIYLSSAETGPPGAGHRPADEETASLSRPRHIKTNSVQRRVSARIADIKRHRATSGCNFGRAVVKSARTAAWGAR